MDSGVRIVISLIMVAVLMIVFPIVMRATHDLQTDEQLDAGLTVSTDEVTLTTDLWDADINSVLSIVGNGTEEPGAITATGYTEATKVLAVTGIVDSTTLDVKYETDALTTFTGMGALVAITPLLIWIALLATVIGNIWFAVRSRG